MNLRLKHPFPSLDKRDAGTHQKASRAIAVRRDWNTLEGMEGSKLVATDGAGPIRAMFPHIPSTGTPTRLVASGTGLLANGVAVADIAAVPYTLDATGKIHFDQEDAGFRTYVVDGANCLRYYDERPGKKFDVALPTTPGAMTFSVSQMPAASINTLLGTVGITINNVAGGAPVGYTVVSEGHAYGANAAFAEGSPHAFDAIDFNDAQVALGTCVHINTDVGGLKNDGFLFDTSSAMLNLQGIQKVSFKLVSGGNEVLTGPGLQFVVGQTAIGSLSNGQPDAYELGIPFNISGAVEEITVDVDLTNLQQGLLNNIKYYGFRIIEAGVRLVVWIAKLTSQSGTTGNRSYVRTRRRVVGTGDYALSLSSPAGPLDADGVITPVVVDAGTVGSSVTLSWTDTGTASYTDLIWRMEENQSAYFYVGEVVSTSSSFTDSVTDVSANAILNMNRIEIPTPAYFVSTYRGRVVIGYEGDLYLSAVDDPTSWSDLTPADIPDAGDLVNSSDGCRLPIGQYGKVVAARRFGVTTAMQFGSGLLLMTDGGYDILLQGNSPEDFDISRVVPGGACGQHAVCKDGGGRVIKVTPEGDVFATGETMQPQYLSNDIEPVIRNPVSGKTDWVLTRDGITGRIVLFTGTSIYTMDEREGGWVELDVSVVGTPTCAMSMPTDDGSVSLIGFGDGTVYQLFDPTVPTMAASYKTAELNLGGQFRVCPMNISALTEGLVTFTLIAVDATDNWEAGTGSGARVYRTVWTGTVKNNVKKGLPRIPGQRYAVQIDVPSGSRLIDASIEFAVRR